MVEFSFYSLLFFFFRKEESEEQGEKWSTRRKMRSKEKREEEGMRKRNLNYRETNNDLKEVKSLSREKLKP